MDTNDVVKGIDIVTDINLPPSIIPTLYEIQKDLNGKGLSRRDLITLCMDRLRRKSLRRSQIEKALDNLTQLEKLILKAHKLE